MPARAGRHQKRLSVGRKLGNEPPVKSRVFSRPHVAAATPGFVADTPVPHAEGIFVPIGGALAGETDRSYGSVTVRHPIVEFHRRAGSDVGGNIWLGSDQPAKMHEF